MGTILNSLAWIPYWYLLAKGITKFTLYQNILIAIISIPLLVFLTTKYNILGASYVWFFINFVSICIGIPIFHFLYFKGEFINWIKNDIIIPLIISLSLLVVGKYFILLFSINLFNVNSLIIYFLINIIIYTLLIPDTRKLLIQYAK